MVKESKKETVEEFAKLISQYPVIGVVNMANIPTKTIQDMRSKLRKNNNILKMTKKRLLKLAFKKSGKPNITELEKHLEGMPALIFTKENPFSLYSFLEKNKSSAPAKPGSTAPKDITVKAGPTSFSPGPIIGQLGKYKIKTGVEGGKIAIKEDAVVAKKGDIIDANLAEILARLGIEPMEIGLNMTAAYENGYIFTSDMLYIDEKEYSMKFATSYSESLNLAVYIAYPAVEALSILIGKSYAESKSLSIYTGFITEETRSDILGKAEAQAMALIRNLPENALSKDLISKKNSGNAAPSNSGEAEKAEQPKEAPKKEEPKQEEAAAGLSSLFG